MKKFTAILKTAAHQELRDALEKLNPEYDVICVFERIAMKYHTKHNVDYIKVYTFLETEYDTAS